ncbi:L,D-transpeptidase [Salinifilum ghardaiensis]
MQVSRVPAAGRRPMLVVLFGVLVALVSGCAGTSTGQIGDTAASPPKVRFAPQDGAEDVSPADPVTAEASGGEIVRAELTNGEGEKIPGTISGGGTRWSADGKLGYDRDYTLTVTVRGSGDPVQHRSTFHTANPKARTYVSMNPLDGQTVGVGQPLAFYFSEDAPAPDKERAEEAIKIRTEPEVEGAFYWFDDREVHWRPKEYWKPGTRIDIGIDVYGRQLGDGVWGDEDRSAQITIGDRVELHADGSSHQMTVKRNGELLRTLPVSLGKPEFPSSNGTHVVTQKHDSYVMNSATFGVPVDAPGGYETEVDWAVRISNGGEFLHAAPWSVPQQGNTNTSHGCINLSEADAKWVYDLLKKGDVVEITNSGGPQLESWDGFGDWQVPWDEWVSGNR